MHCELQRSESHWEQEHTVRVWDIPGSMTASVSILFGGGDVKLTATYRCMYLRARRGEEGPGGAAEAPLTHAACEG